MIAVCVDENGKCKTVTCRWNHDNGGNDNIMSTEELSRLLGVNFYEVFKPSTVFKEKLEKALSLAKKGDLSGFDAMYSSNKNGTAVVKLNNKLNLIDVNGNLVHQQWFDWIDNFNEDGFARVGLNNKWNFMDINGNFLSKQWFSYIYEFENGFAKVILNYKCNLIDVNGNLLSQQWFDGIGNFDKNGFVIVMLNNKYNFIDVNGKLLSQQWFDYIGEAYDYLMKLK